MKLKNISTMLLLLFLWTSCSKSEEKQWNELPEDEITDIADPIVVKALLYPSAEVSLEGIIDTNAKTIAFTTQKWVEDLSLVKLTLTSQNGSEEELDSDSNITTRDIELLERKIELNLVKGEQICTVESAEGGSTDYTIQLISPQTSGLPVIRIDADNEYNIFEHPKEKEYAPSSISLIDYSMEQYSFEEQRGGIRGRGNSTWSLKKKPLRIKFDDKTSLMGLPKEKSWVLLANHLDPTFLMNTVAFELAKRMGLEFTNTDFHVELFHNGEYMGNYQLTEQVQVKKDRVNVDKKTGYLVELDVYFDDENKFKTQKLQLPIMIKYPDEGPFTAIEEDFNSIEELMLSNDFAQADLSNLIDMDSFVKYMLVFELTRNGEIGHPKSVKLYKKKADTPLMAGPVWDFDWAYGYTGKSFDYFNSVDKLLFTPFKGKPNKGRFFRHLLNNHAFKSMYKEVWNNFYQAGTYNLDAFLTEKQYQIEASVLHNQQRWDKNYDFSEKIKLMKEWLNKRIEILNQEINKF